MLAFVQRKQRILGLVAALAVLLLGATGASAQQASITLVNCNNKLCNANNTAWTLAKTPDSQSLTGDGTITWTVTATKGATTDNFITVNGFITVKNTGTADATIGNIVVNLQKPRTGPNTGACRNVPWVSAAADVATASAGDAATSANIVAAASSEVPGCNAAQGANNYTVSGAKGTFSETLGVSGALEFTDADSNTVFSLSPEKTLAPGAQINLLYSAKFDNTVLGLAAGSNVRSEVIVTFGNSGPRGGSGSSAQDIDIDGDGTVNNPGDEHLVRSVPCRVTSAIPTLENGNSTVTLSDTSGDVSVDDSSVTVSNFLTTIGGGTGSEVISGDVTRSVSVDETCSPPGSATVNNTAHLDGASSSVTISLGLCVSNPAKTCTVATQDTDCGTGNLCNVTDYSFTCVAGVNLDDGADAAVACDETLPPPPNFCTYTKGGYGGPGAPGQIFDNNFLTVFSGGLTIGINDGGSSPKHDALWNATATGRSTLKTYLTSSVSGANTALTGDTIDATSTSGGNLPRQTADLTLNVGFDTAGVLPNGSQGLGSLQLCSLVDGSTIGAFTLTAAQAAALNGTSVSQVLTDANNALGGNGLPSYVSSFGDLNQLVTALNASFDNCTASAFANVHLCP
jgi:hypothetical protein